ncbi:hypothetical protein WN51_07764 [Melipona quadrifasciata]|uniref:Uncharacterized protein n=1 Tax=Melipona quadrifasciata TaxID=166423 RepID=A0A0N0U715_9HYME|nr:hypothetical protein WN51_07764 [Melipona quadrifasciata]
MQELIVEIPVQSGCVENSKEDFLMKSMSYKLLINVTQFRGITVIRDSSSFSDCDNKGQKKRTFESHKNISGVVFFKATAQSGSIRIPFFAQTAHIRTGFASNNGVADETYHHRVTFLLKFRVFKVNDNFLFYTQVHGNKVLDIVWQISTRIVILAVREKKRKIRKIAEFPEFKSLLQPFLMINTANSVAEKSGVLIAAGRKKLQVSLMIMPAKEDGGADPAEPITRRQILTYLPIEKVVPSMNEIEHQFPFRCAQEEEEEEEEEEEKRNETMREITLGTSRQEDRCGGSKEQGARSKEQRARSKEQQQPASSRRLHSDESLNIKKSSASFDLQRHDFGVTLGTLLINVNKVCLGLTVERFSKQLIDRSTRADSTGFSRICVTQSETRQAEGLRADDKRYQDLLKMLRWSIGPEEAWATLIWARKHRVDQDDR